MADILSQIVSIQNFKYFRIFKGIDPGLRKTISELPEDGIEILIVFNVCLNVQVILYGMMFR